MKPTLILALSVAAGCSTPIEHEPNGDVQQCGATYDEESAIVAAEQDTAVQGACLGPGCEAGRPTVFVRICKDVTGQLQSDLCKSGADSCTCWAFEVTGDVGRFTGTVGHYAKAGASCPQCIGMSDPVWCSFH